VFLNSQDDFINNYQGAIGMNKIWKSIIFTGLLLTGITTACSSMNTETPAPTASSTATSTPAATPTESAPTVSPTPEFAPFCEAGAASVLPSVQCQIPVVKESSTFCAEKDPYNLLIMNQGLTYEAITKGFRCSDAGIKDGMQMVTCTGRMATDFEINVCDPACVVPTVQAENTQCPQDYNYNNLQGCCTQEAQLVNQNCTAFKFKTTSCITNCGGLNKESKCNKHSYACVWNAADKVCEMRK
jgi:hypothetical protein